MSGTLLVRTNKGDIKGISKNGVDMWLGVPYAKPPVGELRYKRSVEADPWADVRLCDRFAYKPIQFDFSGLSPARGIPESEDCLYLNIWAPEGAKDLPVFFWIYGGGFHGGEGSDPDYDGANMARKGIVFVNFNYRVGPLGAYDFSMYSDDFDSNCSFSDQICALKWVRENIALFGGNPDCITIGGESAGGSSVYDMLGSPATKGMFRRAIAESGLPASFGNRDTMKEAVDMFLDRMQMPPAEIYKLKRMPASKMKEASSWLNSQLIYELPESSSMGCVIGDDLVPEFPWDGIRHGNSKGVDLICGTNHDESSYFTKSRDAHKNWKLAETTLLEFGGRGILDKMRDYYLREPDEYKRILEFSRHRFFYIHHIRCALEQLNYGHVWVYRYDFTTQLLKLAKLDAAHATEIPFALDNLEHGVIRKYNLLTSRKKLEHMRDQMNGRWVNFIKHGNPGRKWQKFTPEGLDTFVFDTHSEMHFNDEREAFELWKNFKGFWNNEF